MMQEQKKKPLFQQEQKKKMLGDEKKPKMLAGAGCSGMKKEEPKK